jgi:NAD(P)-dependent dehydrogenase (short-subunit alcohol dehydrogenase family)
MNAETYGTRLPSLTGKLAVVTGANSGLGFETSVGLATAGARVIMACRNADKANTALDELLQRVPEAQVETMALDLSGLESIRRFAETLEKRHRRLDILCNNAGVMAVPYARTRDGFETHFGVNHLGAFALTGRLIELLNAAPAARIVTVSAIAHTWTRGLDLEDPNCEHRRYFSLDAYSKSKLASLLFTFELERRLRRTGSSAIAVATHPGVPATNLTASAAMLRGPAWLGTLVRRISALTMPTAAAGARSTLYAAAMPDVKGGDYVGLDGLLLGFHGYPKKVRARSMAYDEALASRLWTLSEKLTGVRYPESLHEDATATATVRSTGNTRVGRTSGGRRKR